MQGNEFDIRESRTADGVLRVTVYGELDLETGPALATRLEQLRSPGLTIHLDLSELDFIDSTGIQVLIEAAAAGEELGSELGIEPTLTPQVERVMTLVHADRLLLPDGD
ncbi:MAG TPA: STAS domain-containing protein [Solirubrobacteraceae bacterium]|nr:STAS domain-containing protein [Solirubrobacteraceae bacterium]